MKRGTLILLYKTYEWEGQGGGERLRDWVWIPPTDVLKSIGYINPTIIINLYDRSL